MGCIYLPGFQVMLNPPIPIGMLLVGVKLLLAGTTAMATHPRLRPKRIRHRRSMPLVYTMVGIS